MKDTSVQPLTQPQKKLHIDSALSVVHESGIVKDKA